MVNYRRLMLENKRDAAVQRRAKIAADLKGYETDTKRVRPIWLGETAGDARENAIHLLRQMLVDLDNAIAVMNEDLEQGQL